MRTAKTLIRLGGCPGLSESLLGAQSLCWFCHVAFILSIQTDRSGQGLHCLPSVCIRITIVKQHCSSLRIITTVFFLGCQNFSDIYGIQEKSVKLGSDNRGLSSERMS